MNEIFNSIIRTAKTAKASKSRLIHAFIIDRIGFKVAHELQDKVQALRIAGEIGDIFLIVEHNPVYTITKHTDRSHLLYDDVVLKQKGIEIAEVDRGGDITYHGPGQIVGYPIINLKNFNLSVKTYVKAIEQTLINALLNFGINACIDKNAPGVWVNSKKIAALGIRISRYVTKHGFALNNMPDLSHFQGIIPCGLSKPVTSIFAETGQILDKQTVSDKIITSMRKVLNCELIVCEQ
ncbi:MAG: lipoyl(octanoyl) transferase LipB [Planctomycetes bacterium]|nr:lipoyl(octanoyl) transferase LipB [Planctomycetota bacterium]